MNDRNIHAGQLIADSDATIAAALEDVSIPTRLVAPVDRALLVQERRGQDPHLEPVAAGGLLGLDAGAEARLFGERLKTRAD
jgi:hypothetical protein